MFVYYKLFNRRPINCMEINFRWSWVYDYEIASSCSVGTRCCDCAHIEMSISTL